MLTVALAGKPNAGKSTFFEAATRSDVEAANYPFTTIEPNRGVAYVRTDCPCRDLDQYCDSEHCRAGKRYVPVELLDVAGLVPEAHTGRGLGNQFLDELTTADVIIHVVDAAGSTDEEGNPVEPGTYDPRKEIDFIETQLDRWLADLIDRNWETVTRQARSPDFDIDDALTELLSGVGATAADIATCLRSIEYPDAPDQWDQATKRELASTLRAQTKPILIAANKIDLAPTETIDTLIELDRPVVPMTAEGELALRRAAEAGLVEYDPGDPTFDIIGNLDADQRTALDDLRSVLDTYDGTGLQAALNRAVYDLLDQVTVYPVEDPTHWTDSQGRVLPDAHLLDRGSTPRDLAYAIHSDIGDGYLYAVDARSSREIADAYELTEGDVVKIVSTA